MKFYTWAEIRAKVERECDLEDEDFVRPEELLDYANEAIDEAEAEIHGLYEDYFLSETPPIPVVANDTVIDMVTNLPNIYADKIRKIIFTSGGGSVYPVTRLKNESKFEEKALADVQPTSDLYKYMLVNTTPGAPEIQIVPKIHEAGNMKIWYLRNANRLAVDTDVCDIPEFINFIFAHMKMKVFAKEGHPGYPEALERLERERERMLGTLQARVPDADNQIELDTSIYDEMS